MKSFKEYLTESKKVYEFKVKIAGDCPKDCTEKIKLALSQYQLESCSGGKRTPIQERQVDFPEHTNVNVTVFDVCTCYPATSSQVKNAIAETLKMSGALIKVRNAMEETDIESAFNSIIRVYKSGKYYLVRTNIKNNDINNVNNFSINIYDEYRDEQKKNSNKPVYAILWKNKNIYKTIDYL